MEKRRMKIILTEKDVKQIVADSLTSRGILSHDTIYDTSINHYSIDFCVIEPEVIEDKGEEV